MKVIVENGKLVVSFSERMDTIQCQAIEKALQDQINQRDLPVVFDLKGVSYIASMFLRLCIQAIKKCGEQNFSFIHAEPPIKKVIKMAGYDQWLVNESPE